MKYSFLYFHVLALCSAAVLVITVSYSVYGRVDRMTALGVILGTAAVLGFDFHHNTAYPVTQLSLFV